ncbi:hypothetical protein PENSPDRAFT_403304 [Peniophora sp. CONT]|nr:hypothetical protein PENSPDRAFT_403304 [Peniophora sp. CONT]
MPLSYADKLTASPKVIGYSVLADDDADLGNSDQVNLSPVSPYSFLSTPSIDRNHTLDSFSGHSSQDGFSLVRSKDERSAQAVEDAAVHTEQMEANRKAASDRVKIKNLERKAQEKEENLQKKRQDALQRLLEMINGDEPGAEQPRLSIQLPIEHDGSVGEAYIGPNPSQNNVTLPDGALRGVLHRDDNKLTTHAASDSSDDEPDLTLLYPSPPPSPPRAHAAIDVDGMLHSCMKLIAALTVLEAPQSYSSSKRNDSPYTHASSQQPMLVPLVASRDPRKSADAIGMRQTSGNNDLGRERLNALREQWQLPRAVRMAKRNVLNSDARANRKKHGKHSPPDYQLDYKPLWAHTPQEAMEYSTHLDRHVLPKLYMGEGNYDLDGSYRGATREGALASYVAGSLGDWAISVRLVIAEAMAHNLEYRGRCSRQALPMPAYQRLMYPESVGIEQIHRDMHRCGISPDEVDYSMGPTVKILEWAVKTQSGVVKPRMRERCRNALIVARERLSRLKPMPHHYMPYRAALLERILVTNYDKVKRSHAFSASDYQEIASAYTPEVHERRFGLL